MMVISLLQSLQRLRCVIQKKIPPPPTGKKAQHGFSKNSGMFCEKVSYFGQARERSNEDREEEKYGFGRIIEVPNKKKNLAHYVIEYDRSIHEDDTVVVQYTTHLPNTKEIKLLLKEAFARADEIEYRFGGPTKKKKARATAQSIPAIPAVEGGTILLSGILNENVNVDPTSDELAASNEDGEE